LKYREDMLFQPVFRMLYKIIVLIDT